MPSFLFVQPYRRNVGQHDSISQTSKDGSLPDASSQASDVYSSEGFEIPDLVAYNRRKNQQLIKLLRPGTHIATTTAIQHHAIFCSPDRVIHYMAPDHDPDDIYSDHVDSRWFALGTASGSASGSYTRMEVQRWTMSRFIKTWPEWSVIAVPTDVEEGRIIQKRAEARLGEQDFGLFTNNCEHFATSCFKGEDGRSGQLSSTGATIAVSGVVVGSTVATVSGTTSMAYPGILGWLGYTTSAAALHPVLVVAVSAGAAAVASVSAVGLHIWGKSRIASRTPVCIFNGCATDIDVCLVADWDMLASVRASWFGDGLKSSTIPSFSFVELNPPIGDAFFWLQSSA